PGLATNRDAMLFLLLVESRPDKDPADYEKGMRAIHATVVNRLRYNVGGAFNAPGAKYWRDIIGARGQFAGFSTSGGRLTAEADQQNRLNAFYRIANNSKDRRQPQYRKFIKTAEAVLDEPGEDPFED